MRWQGNLSRNKTGLSIVITTLIILVASLILAASVATFGTSLFQTSSKQEALTVSNIQIFVESSGTNHSAAFLITNTGEATTTVSKISLRGVSVSLSELYINRLTSTEILSGNLQGPNGTIVGGASSYKLCTTFTTGNDCTTAAVDYTRSDASFAISPRESVIVYVSGADVESSDIGGHVTLTLVATRAVIGTQATASQA